MKIDAKVRFIIDDDVLQIHVDQTEEVLVDLDYIDDYDDVVQSVEERLYKKFNAILANEVDFVIENAAELCEEISS